MLRLGLKLLLLMAAHLPLLYAELSQTEETSSMSARLKGNPDSCGKDCEDHRRVRKRSTLDAKCELYYFVPTAKQGETFAFWNNTRAEQLEAYYKILPFLQTNPHEEKPIFFPAHLPLVEKRNGSEVLVLQDVYVRAKGTCGMPLPGWTDYYDTNPAWYKNADLRLQEELKMLEDYIQLMPRSHFGYRAPTDGEDDVCLDETGLVVKDFPDIRTCFSMWIFDDADQKPKHFAGRQIYNRINQQQHMNTSAIGFNPSKDEYLAEPISTDMLSLPALFLKEMCEVTSISLPNRCAYWASDRFYVSLCCCYTNRRECAYKEYKFPAEKKEGDPVIRACATGDYYALKDFGGTREPRNASGSSVKEFVQERTSSQFCKWTYTWNTSNKTRLEDALRVDLDAAATITDWMKDCAEEDNSACCHPTSTLCPMDQVQATGPIVVECVCVDGDLCNKRHSYVDKELMRTFKKARPCEIQTPYEHLLSLSDDYKKPSTNLTYGYMCPVFYNFAQPGRPNTFLQLANGNNLWLSGYTDIKLFQQDGCNLIEVTITEQGACPEKLFGDNKPTDGLLLILLCSVEGNPLGERRTSYPDAELKKTVSTNLTAAKEAFHTCKNGSWLLDFESVSELVVDNSKLEHIFNGITNGTNDNITTAHCYVEVSFAYQQQYHFTFGAVSIDDRPLFDACLESESSQTCVQRNSAAHGEHQHFACCCRRHWNQPKDECRVFLLHQLKALLNENAIAQKPQDIMTELKRDPLTKCFDAEKTHDGQAGTDVNRPCARNEGCYTGVHARDVRTSTQHKKFGGCVSKDAPDAKKRDDATNDEVEARFHRICRLLENDGQCFAVLGTEDSELPDDVKGPQMVCCCKGQVETTHKCGSSHKMGAKIGDLV